MAFLVDDLLEVLERLAPAALAEEWDNIGLQTGSRAAGVRAVLVTLGVTGGVLDEAAAQGCEAILTHHPLIFPAITSASEDTAAGRLIIRANRDGIAVIAAHTNLDNANGGLADMLAELAELRNVEPLEGAAAEWSKLVAFVPPDALDRVRGSLFAAGAGVIGDYRHCSWYARGTGTFRPVEGARPAVGEVGKDEDVEELRLETVFPTARIGEVISALLKVHPYEEPAYDVYPLDARSRSAGSGRVGELSLEMTLADFAGSLAELFGLKQARYAGDPQKVVRRVAIVPGSGAGCAGAAALKADVLVTGDIKYHDALTAAELGIALVDIPHDLSERMALANWVPILRQELSAHGLKVFMSDAATDPWREAAAGEKAEPRASARLPLSETEKAQTNEEEKSMHHLHVDGGSRGNPGPAGIGVVLAGPDGEVIDTLANYIGKATNNIAEYQAMVSGLELALERGVNRLAIFSDSELIVRQLEGAYKVKNEGLRPYYQEAKSLLSRLEEYEMQSIPREANAHADELVNRALDEAGF